jgi:catechol 2,3-dioxygenase-like lactoylglutathione lyase family enzyme
VYIDHVGINTNDVEATLQFYCGILGMRLVRTTLRQMGAGTTTSKSVAAMPLPCSMVPSARRWRAPTREPPGITGGHA